MPLGQPALAEPRAEPAQGGARRGGASPATWPTSTSISPSGIGLDDYTWIADHFAFVLGGERLFAKHYFGDATARRRIATGATCSWPPIRGLTEQDRRDYRARSQHTSSRFSTIACGRSIGRATTWSASPRPSSRRCPRCAWPGGSSGCGPQTKIVFGGAACEGRDGHRTAAAVPRDRLRLPRRGRPDVPRRRRADPLRAGRSTLPPRRGRASTAAERSRARLDADVPEPRRCAPRGDLDDLPYPDFDDYFARLQRSPLRDRDRSAVVLRDLARLLVGREAPLRVLRAQRRAAGLSAARRRARAVDELRYLVERYGVHRACSADNILDHRYFDTLLPMLRDAGLDLAIRLRDEDQPHARGRSRRCWTPASAPPNWASRRSSRRC